MDLSLRCVICCHKDARLLEIVLTRVPGRKHEFKLISGA